MVGVTGLEPAASWSRTKRTTKLCHTPAERIILYHKNIRLSILKSNFNIILCSVTIVVRLKTKKTIEKVIESC